MNQMLKIWLPSPGSSVGSDAGYQYRGCEFKSQLGQHSFRRLTRVTVTCVIHLSPMGCLTVYVEKEPVAWKGCCVVYWCGKSKKRMSRWTGRRDMTEKLLKTALNPNQSINHIMTSDWPIRYLNSEHRVNFYSFVEPEVLKFITIATKVHTCLVCACLYNQCHNVFKSRLLQTRWNVSASWKGLTLSTIQQNYSKTLEKHQKK